MSLFATVSPAAAQDGTITCYAVADGDVGNDGLNNETVPDTLVRIDDALGAATATVLGGVGAITSTDAEAMAIRRGDATPIYAWETSLGLFTINPTTGVSEGAAGFQVGAEKVEGLAWANTDDEDLSNDILYVIRTSGDVTGYNDAGAVVVATTNPTTAALNEGADVAWDPATDTVYAVITNNADVSEVVVVSGAGPAGGPTDLDMEGAGFDLNGQMYGTTGNDGADALHTIDKASGAAVLLIDLEAATTVFDHEDVDCIDLEFPPDPGVISAAITDSCVDDDGKITATVTYVSGELPVDYSVTITGQADATGTISSANSPVMEMTAGLADGSYTVTVTDTTNNTELASQTVAVTCDPAAPGVIAAGLSITCVNDDGKATVNLTYESGDVAVDYTVTLTGADPQTGTIDANNSPQMAMFADLVDGSYTITVTDTTNSVTVLNETAPVACDPVLVPGVIAASLTTECLDNLGKATITITYSSGDLPVDYTAIVGGQAPQTGTIDANNSPVMAMFPGLADGTYSVSLTDTTNNVTVLTETITDLGCELPDPGTIMGNVFTDLDADGQEGANPIGIGGLTVTLWTVDGAGAPDAVVTTVVTADGTGKYTFADVPPGDYIVAVAGPAGSTFTSQNVGPDATDSDVDAAGLTDPITVGEGQMVMDVDAGILPDPGSIMGIVFTDADSDGQEGANPAGIGGLTVTLWTVDGAGAPDQVVTTTTTAAGSGAYTFTNVAPGDYIVAVAGPAGSTFTSSNVGDDATDSDVDAAGLTAPITVGDGQMVIDVDAGVLPDPGAVTTEVTHGCLGGNGIIRFKVTNTTDTAVDATLRVAGLPDRTITVPADGMVTVARSGRADGVYAVEGLIDGTSVYTADITIDCDEPIVETTLVNQCLAGNGIFQFRVTNGTDAAVTATLKVAGLPDKTVTVAANSSQSISRSGRPDGSYLVEGLIDGQSVVSQVETVGCDGNGVGPVTIGNRVWNDSDGDGVQEINQNGVIGATVNLWSVDGAGAPDSVIATTTTGAAGIYQFANVAAGDYRVQVVAPAGFVFTAQNSGGPDTTDSDFDAAGISDLFTMAPGSTNNSIDAGLVADDAGGGSATLGNRVWMDLDGDGLQENNENGVIGATVNLWSVDGAGAPDSVIATTTTAAAGLYQFVNVPAGDYRVQVVAPGGYSYTVINAGADTLDSDVDAAGISDLVTLAAGQTNNTVDAGLVQESMGGTATLGNRVWNDSDGDGLQEINQNGVVGTTVNLWSVDGAGAPVAIISTTMTGAGGIYQFTGLAAGDYRIQVVAPTGFVFTAQNSGGPDSSDSDVDAAGISDLVSLAAGQTDNTVDAGVVAESSGQFTYNVAGECAPGGRVKIEFNNGSDQAVNWTYDVVEVTQHPVVEGTSAPGSTITKFVTGRPDGTYTVVLTIDGVMVTETVVIDCIQQLVF